MLGVFVAGPVSFWSRLDWLAAWLAGLGIVVGGVVAGREFLAPHSRHLDPGEPFVHAFVHWDANYYKDIAEEGYSYVPHRQSTIHFFPGYAVMAWILVRCTGISLELALVLLSNLFFGASLFLIGLYVDRRFGQDAGNLRVHVLLAVALVPVGFFFRMAYTESMFFFLVVLELYLIDRRASPWAIAGTAGVASAMRPVGIMLAVPLLWYLLAMGRRDKWLWARLPACLVVSISGLLAFMLYCYISFGDPIVFARNRIALWAIRPSPPLLEKVWLMASFEPVRAVFDPSSPGYWGAKADPPDALFSLYPVNPLYVVGGLGLIAVGVWKHWLTTPETLAALGLVLLPYCLNGYEAFLSGRARHVSTAFPLYLVAGKLLEPLSLVWKAPLMWLSGALMAGYSAHFAQWYWLT
jgi:hypothetical protein